MKKLLTFSLLFLGLLSGARAQTCGTTITTYPYLENFDGATAAGWISGGANSSWALGTPAKTVINSAASGTKAWVTSLTGIYNASEQSYVESPCFNMSTLVQPVIEMKIWWNSEFSWDGAVLQSSINNGATWQNVGIKGDPNNWYNDNSINGMPGGQPASIAEGWSGRTASNNGSGGWVTAKHLLNGLGGQPNVKLRIAFGSDSQYEYDGFAFDSFSIFDSPANDASVASISSPSSSVAPLVSQPVTVTIKNYGISPLTSATVGFSVNKVVQPAFTWTGNVALNATSAPVQIGNFAFPAGVHILKVWTKNPNGATDANAANDTTTITVNAGIPLSGNYTIDKNNPTAGTNFISFAAAAQALASFGVSGPVVFTVAPGSGPYSELVKFTNPTGGSATNTITFEGNGNTISATPTAAIGGVLKLDGAQFFRFNNFRIDNLSTATSAGVFLANNASNNTFSGCTINHNLASGSILYGINLEAGCNTNSFQNNLIIGGYYGVHSYGSYIKFLDGNQFTGNVLKDQYSYGFYLMYNTNALIENNDISRPTRTNVTNFYGVYLTTGTNGTIVNRNRIHNSHDAATITTHTVSGVHIVAPATPGNENIIKNNAVYNINNQNGIFNGFYNIDGANSYYYHNTVISDPDVTYNTLRGMHFSGNVTNAKFINNIISIPSAASTKHAIYLGNTSTVLVSNYNNFNIGSSGNTGFFAIDQATLADWKAVNSNAYDQNSLAVDPIFASSSYLQPANPLLNNSGQPLPAVTEDIYGTTRSTTTPDMGALEFTPPANDAGIMAVVAPVSPATPGNQTVQVTLRNFGTANLTSATIGWSANGVTQPNVLWSGTLTNLQTSAPINIGSFNLPAGNSTLKVWSKLPNGLPDALAANDTLVQRIFSCTPLAGNYTINKNNPTAGTNFQSFADLTQKLTSCGVSGPVTINVVAGTGPYNEQVELGNIPYTSAFNTVTFEGNGNTISANPWPKPGIFVLNGAKYVKLNNFEFTLNASAGLGCGVQLINAADYATISNNTINMPLSSTYDQINGILAGVNVNVAGNNTNNTKIQNNIINGGFYGIQINGDPNGLNAANNEITGNQVKDPAVYGIYLNNANSTLVEGNDISRATRTNGAVFYNIYLNGATMKAIVSKNKMHNANDMTVIKTGALYGVYITAAATPGNENIISNNIIYNLNGTNGNFYGFYNSGGSGAYYYYNSIASDPAIPYNTLRGFQIQAAASNLKFINNIISLPGTALSKHAIYLPASGLTLESRNNDFFVGNSGNVGHYVAIDHPTLASWKTANSNAYDQNSVSADPVFVNPAAGNLKPNAMAVKGLAQPLPAVTDDILGVARHATTPDPGAYEFGIPANDVGIISVSSPNALNCGMSATETITVTIRNFGSNPQPAVPVMFSVNGTPMALTPETYNAGLLAPNATATYTFSAKANLANPGKFQIIAKTQLTGDLDAANDADTLEIHNPLISAMPFTLDFETPATGISFFRKESSAKANIAEHVTASSPLVTTSTKGLIMDGVTNSAWTTPVGLVNPWTDNPDHQAAINFCVNPVGGTATDSLWLTFDIKQLFKTANANTNFRVKVNGTQEGPTYRPPFNPNNPATPNTWRHIKVDLFAYKNAPSIMIGLESNVMQDYANGAGTANLIDNVRIARRLVTTTGVIENTLSSQLKVYPNPGNGLFNVSLPAGKAFNLEITDLTGKVIQRRKTLGETRLKLENTAKGIYLMKVTGEDGSAIRKLIVE